jgi:hypothetical protein
MKRRSRRLPLPPNAHHLHRTLGQRMGTYDHRLVVYAVSLPSRFTPRRPHCLTPSRNAGP